MDEDSKGEEDLWAGISCLFSSEKEKREEKIWAASDERQWVTSGKQSDESRWATSGWQSDES